MNTTATRPEGLQAIDREMARQHADALASFRNNGEMAEKAAASLKRTGKLLLLGMGGSHAVGRAVEPLYRGLGVDAIDLPLSEQLGAPLSLNVRLPFEEPPMVIRLNCCSVPSSPVPVPASPMVKVA